MVVIPLLSAQSSSLSFYLVWKEHSCPINPSLNLRSLILERIHISSLLELKCLCFWARRGYLVFHSAIFQILHLWFLRPVVIVEKCRVRLAHFEGIVELRLLIYKSVKPIALPVLSCPVERETAVAMSFDLISQRW